jgi:hypothetical protein
LAAFSIRWRDPRASRLNLNQALSQPQSRETNSSAGRQGRNRQIA